MISRWLLGLIIQPFALVYILAYFFKRNAVATDGWQMDSTKEYGLKTFVFKKQGGIEDGIVHTESHI